MNSEKNITSVLILAGGNSTRMGYPKAWLKKDNGTAFLLSIIYQYKKLGIEDVIVVINKNSIDEQWMNQYLLCLKNARIIKNNHPEKGRLHSIHLGLKATNAKSIFIHNVDNPYVEDEVIRTLPKKMKDDITIPSFNKKGGHPIIINQLIKDEIIHNYKNYDTLKDLVANYNKHYVFVNSDSIFININTPKDFENILHESA